MSTLRSGDARGSDRDKGSDDEVGDAVADEVEEAVDERPWLESLAQIGWIAKGVVYLLMGATTVTIARQKPTEDDASPSGALDRVMEQPGGRALIVVLGVGLLLYFFWRVLSVAVIRGNDMSAWLHRIGYAFSALFYGSLIFASAKLTLSGRQQGDDTTVERLSRSAMGSGTGRILVGVVGIVVVIVGLVFIVHKGIMRSFVDELHGVSGSAGDDAIDHTVVVSGVIGWIGRGVVTVLVGFFVTRAAVRFDPNEARGFDNALREVATSPNGSLFVWACAIGLILYGAFCLLSHRYRRIEDAS